MKKITGIKIFTGSDTKLFDKYFVGIDDCNGISVKTTSTGITDIYEVTLTYIDTTTLSMCFPRATTILMLTESVA